MSGDMGGFAKSTGRNLLNTVAGNAAGMAWKSVSKNIPRPGDPDSTMGKLLGGTMFGADPMQQAGVTLLTAGEKLDMAAEKMLSMSPSGGGGGFSSAAGTFARLAGSSGLFANMPRTYAPGSSDFNSAYNDPLMATAGYGTSEFGADGVPTTVPLPTGRGGGSSAWAAKAAGIGVAAAAGAFGAYSGFQAGGAQGALTGTGSLVGAGGAIAMMAGLSGPLAPILLGVGMALPLISSLLGDPKQNRAKDLALAAQQRSYTMPSGADYSMDASGRYSDYNYRGGTRTGNTINIYAMDSKSMVDYFVSNPTIIPTGLSSSIAGGNADDVVGLLQQRAN
jgi:hypothetical protein